VGHQAQEDKQVYQGQLGRLDPVAIKESKGQVAKQVHLEREDQLGPLDLLAHLDQLVPLGHEELMDRQEIVGIKEVLVLLDQQVHGVT
jgi:hypothetical protein